MPCRRYRVEGRTALVTGGSSGIGRQLALDLARAGCTVVIASHDDEKLAEAQTELRAISPTSFAVRCDVTSQTDVDSMAATVLGRLGHLDILVNNAGYAVYRTFVDTDPEELERLIQVNLLGVIRCSRAFVPEMVGRRDGVIVNIASIAGRLPLTPHGTYTAAKHGVFGFTKTLRYELADFGVRPIVVCPGRVETAFFDHETFLARAPRAETRYTVPIEQVTSAIIDAIERDRPLTYIPRSIGVLTWGWNAVPFLAEPVFRRLNIARVRSYYAAAPSETANDHA
jgi:NAD(P)-dependent dehydrogenase (short-subunit alcohol dehydrogenase family)